jgi:transcriptional regulator with XRE-family HTH domain
MDLADIRRKAGFKGQALADVLGWDQGKVSRVEKGKQALDEVDLMSWLIACDVKRAKLRQVVEQGREATRQTWVLPYGPASGDSRNLSVEESEAKSITVFACMLIPGLLQTPEYARAVVEQFQEDEVTIERVVARRLARQEVLRGEHAPKTVFYIEEQALIRPADSPETTHDQLMHLMFMADWKKVSIRVLPTEVGLHKAGTGAFILIKRRDLRSIAWVDTRATSVIFESEEDVKRFQDSVSQLATLALNESDSRALIARLALERGSPRKDPDGTAGDLA